MIEPGRIESEVRNCATDPAITRGADTIDHHGRRDECVSARQRFKQREETVKKCGGNDRLFPI